MILLQLAPIANNISNNWLGYGILLAVFAAIAYRLIKGRPKGVIINRAELIKAKMVAILSVNKVKMTILEQEGNIIGLVRNFGFYIINKKRIYLLLYNPRLFWNVPKFWEKEVMIISEGNIDKIEEPRKLFLGRVSTNRIIKYLVVKKDYFLDRYFNCIINMTDGDALELLETKILQDEAEIGSSVYVAQTMRLQTVKLGEAFSTASPQPLLEKRNEEIKYGTK